MEYVLPFSVGAFSVFFFFFNNARVSLARADYRRCRNWVCVCWESRAIRASPILAWSRSERSSACFVYCQQFCLSKFCLHGSLNFIFAVLFKHTAKKHVTRAVYQTFTCALWLTFCPNMTSPRADLHVEVSYLVLWGMFLFMSLI